MGMIIFDIKVLEAVRGQKHPLVAKKWHEGVDLLKKVFAKVFQQPQKPFKRSNQI